MGLHTDLKAFLEGSAAIAAAVPGGVFHENYPQQQATFPVLCFQKAGANETDVDMEYPDEPAGDVLNEARYQLDIWGTTTEQVIEAEIAVDAAMRALRGLVGSTRIQRVIRASSQDLGERYGDKRRRRVSIDYIISHS